MRINSVLNKTDNLKIFLRSTGTILSAFSKRKSRGGKLQGSVLRIIRIVIHITSLRSIIDHQSSKNHFCERKISLIPNSINLLEIAMPIASLSIFIKVWKAFQGNIVSKKQSFCKLRPKMVRLQLLILCRVDKAHHLWLDQVWKIE